jgi:hypothetical protein
MLGIQAARTSCARKSLMLLPYAASVAVTKCCCFMLIAGQVTVDVRSPSAGVVEAILVSSPVSAGWLHLSRL